MKRSFTRTLFTQDITTAIFKLYVYPNTTKYDAPMSFSEVVNFTGVKSWDIIEGGVEADEIEQERCGIDENREYLVLNFVDGSSSVFRNSHVDMFIK